MAEKINSPIIHADNDSLEKRIEMLERDNKELKEKLEQAEKDRVQYLQNVSHQLVAPLNAIKWHIENLTEGRLMNIERIQKVLRSIYSQSTIAVHLAKNFNLMSNLEADHALSALKEPLQEINLCRLLINLANDFQPLAWDKEVIIQVKDNGFESAPSVLAMKPLISQVFSNIIENAVKYSANQTKILIDGSFNQDSDMVLVRIRNRGIQLRDEDIRQIFERGFRSPEAKNAYPAGTGFGLYIARRIVEIHEGIINAINDIDDGGAWVTFWVMLSRRGLEGKARKRVQKKNITHR